MAYLFILCILNSFRWLQNLSVLISTLITTKNALTNLFLFLIKNGFQLVSVVRCYSISRGLLFLRAPFLGDSVRSNKA